MKTRHWIIAFGVTAVLAVGMLFWLIKQLAAPPAEPVALDRQQAEIATRFLDHLDAQRFDEAHAMLASDAAAALGPDKLAEVWTTLPEQLGGPATRGDPRGEVVGNVAITTFRLEFPNMALDARVSTDEASAIDGFRIVPATAAAAAAPPPAESGLAEREFEVAGLPGTLTLPADSADRHPAVVLVHGSGPLDRDETIGPNKPFRDLAHGLAANGVAVLRFDKRTLASPGDFADGSFTVDDETVNDAVAAIRALQATPGIDPERVFVAGHSLGAMMAPRIAQRAPEVAGLVLLAAPARPLHEIVPQQIRYLADQDGERSAEEQQGIDDFDAAAAAVAAIDDETPAGPMMLGLPAAYWRDLLGYDAVGTASTLPQPLLILHGGRDYQVTVEDFRRWEQALAAHPAARLQLYPAMNHLFATGEGPSTPAEYLQPTPLDARVVTDIAEWIHAH